MSQPDDASAPTPPAFPKSTTRPAPAKGRFGFSRVFCRWWWLGTLAVVTATVLVSMVPGWLNMRGPMYESTALVEVKPIMDAHPLTGSHSSMPISSNFINTQFEVISAQNTLDLALEKHDLLNRLGGDRGAAITRMQQSISARQMRGTDLIRISYRDEDRELAKDACTAVYEAYRDRRLAIEMNIRRDQLKAIKMELQSKKDRVAELRKRLMDIGGKVGMRWVESENGGKVIGGELELRQLAEKQLYETEREREQLAFQIQKLLAADEDDLLPSAAEISDAGFKEVYKKYEDSLKQIETLKEAGLAEAHPKVKLLRERTDELEKQLKKRAKNIREAMKHRKAILEQRVKKMKEVRNRQQDEGTDRARSFQEFNIARKDYEVAQGIADQMQVKHDIERTKLAIPPNNIIVHQTPEINPTPVTRGKDFVTIVGTTASLPFSMIGGIVLMYLAEAIFPRRV